MRWFCLQLKDAHIHLLGGTLESNEIKNKNNTPKTQPQ